MKWGFQPVLFQQIWIVFRAGYWGCGGKQEPVAGSRSSSPSCFMCEERVIPSQENEGSFLKGNWMLDRTGNVAWRMQAGRGKGWG